MLRPELYQKTVDILVQAYFNDTLFHGNCYACAVGNIVATNMGLTFVRNNKKDILDFQRLNWKGFSGYETPPISSGVQDTITFFLIGDERKRCIPEKVEKQITATGYSRNQLQEIENAFEKQWRNYSEDDKMFGGLMAVVDTLDQLHENTDEETTKQSKQKFINPSKTKTQCQSNQRS